MADKITTYTPETARAILDRLNRLEQRQNALLSGGYNQAFPQGPLVTRWGKTSITPDYVTYPSSGNVVGVSLGNYKPSPLYPGATAVKTFTAYDPPIYVFATLENGSLPAEGTEVRLTWRNGQWWITPDAGATIPTAIMFGGNSYNTDSSNKNRVKFVSTGHADNRVGYLHFATGWGDFTATGVDMLTTASSVGGGTHAATAPCFKLTQAGLYRFILRFRDEDTTPTPSVGTDTLTSSLPSAGTAHTHTVDARREHAFRSIITVSLQWRNSGGGGFTTSEEMYGYTPVLHWDTMAGTTYEADEETATFVFWQNHNSPDREYRVQFSLVNEFDSASTYTQRDIYADSGVLEVTRLADYAADQTLSY